MASSTSTGKFDIPSIFYFVEHVPRCRCAQRNKKPCSEQKHAVLIGCSAGYVQDIPIEKSMEAFENPNFLKIYFQ